MIRALKYGRHAWNWHWMHGVILLSVHHNRIYSGRLLPTMKKQWFVNSYTRSSKIDTTKMDLPGMLINYFVWIQKFQCIHKLALLNSDWITTKNFHFFICVSNKVAAIKGPCFKWVWVSLPDPDQLVLRRVRTSSRQRWTLRDPSSDLWHQREARFPPLIIINLRLCRLPLHRWHSVLTSPADVTGKQKTFLCKMSIFWLYRNQSRPSS